MPHFRRKWPLFVLIAFLAAGTAFVLTSYGGVFADADGSGESLRTVLEVISLVKTQYFQDVDALKMISKYVEKGTINGMLKETLKDDPYTHYMDSRAWEQEQISIFGVYGGIGITVGMHDGKITIVAPYEGTPGFQAGLRSGDQILAIDGRSTEHMSLDEAVSYMRGPEGTSITLDVRRRSGEIYTAEITRAVIEVPSVAKVEVFQKDTFPGQTHPIGYIRLQNFSQRTDQEMAEALARVEREQAAGLILDLRDNLGGTFNAAVDVADRFMYEGQPIVHVVERGDQRKTFYSTSRLTYPMKPLVILVNGFSASASEILSGALQDLGYAVVVGNQTFGKGLVQMVVPLRDGTALSLTTAKYQTANGRDIHKEGIVPDIEVDFPLPDDPEDYLFAGESFEDDPQFMKALDVLMEGIAARTGVEADAASGVSLMKAG